MLRATFLRRQAFFRNLFSPCCLSRAQVHSFTKLLTRAVKIRKIFAGFTLPGTAMQVQNTERLPQGDVNSIV